MYEICVQLWFFLLGSMFSQAMKKWVQGNTDEVNFIVSIRKWFLMSAGFAYNATKVLGFLFSLVSIFSIKIHQCFFIRLYQEKGGLSVSTVCLMMTVNISLEAKGAKQYVHVDLYISQQAFSCQCRNKSSNASFPTLSLLDVGTCFSDN